MWMFKHAELDAGYLPTLFVTDGDFVILVQPESHPDTESDKDDSA
jgi:hypothetical protein